MAKFRLSENFLSDYIGKQPAWGPLGYIVYKRTYARPVPEENRTEEYWETIKRVVEGTYNIQKEWCEKNVVYWNGVKAQNSAQEMFKLMWDFKFLPPGRGLWMMGTDFVEKKGSAALNNCAFVSTKDLATDFAEPFTFLMDMSMLGVGVGGDTKGAGTIRIKEPRKGTFKFVVEDSREGWVELVRTYLNAYVGKGSIPGEVDYSKVRPYGAPINGFGGTSSGPGPLKQLVESDIPSILDPLIEQEGGVTGQAIVDIFNAIGRCVVSGNVRRSAEIMFGEPEDTEFLELKNPAINADKLQAWRWASNNSVFAKVGMDYSDVATRTATNGEPGYFWLQNARDWGRFADPPNYKDRRAEGANPCVTADTWIHTPYGPRQVQDLIGKEFFAQVDGQIELSKIGFFKTKKNAQVYKLITKEGYSVRLTEDHKVKVQSKVGSHVTDSWISANKLTPGRDHIYLSECCLSEHWEGEGKMGEGYILGLLTGDGTVKKDKAVLSVWSKGNPGYKGILDAVLTAIKDMPSRSDFQGWTFIPNREEYRLSLAHIDGLCDKFNLGTDKQIGPKIEKASLEFYRGFLRGFFDSDGSVQGTQQKGVSIRLGQTDLKRLEATQRMLLRLNIVSTIYKNRKESGTSLLPDGKGGKKPYPTKAIHELVISGESISTFRDLIGFSDTYKQGLLDAKLNNYKRNLNKNKYTAEFVELIPDGIEDVYDATIEEMHCFDANGLIVHNCSEQTLESYELCCVSADTKILTRLGYCEISKLVDKKVEVWNGQEWSQVTPFVAGHNKDLYRVHLSDGSYLDVTDNHKWSARFPTASKFKQFETMQLEVGMQLESTEIQANDMYGSFSVGDMAYAWGFFAGDGFIDNKQIMLALHGSKDALTKDYFENIGGKIYKEQHPEGYSESFSRVNLTAIEDRTVSLNLAKELNDKNKGIPSHFFSMNHEDTLGFIAGWIDSDGSLTNQVDTDNYRIFGTETKMRDMQLLLRRVGVNHASIYKMASAGEVLVINNKEVTRKHDLWVCYIPSYECKEIAEYCIIKKATRFGDRYKTNNAYPNGAKIDKARNQYVESIEKLDGKHTVYCFTEPKRHMGVFGNVLTYQCLVETFPGRHESLAEYIRTLKYAYLYAKTVTLLPTHNARTNAVMLRNRRIGTSQSGVVESFAKHGIREHYRWCDEGYKYLRSLDVVYSEWLCIPESRKITSIKPSGTVSLLPGASPGVHFPYGEYYWRTVRFDSGSELLEALRRSGYRIEQGETETTSVVYFPVKEQNFTRARRDVSIWEQLEIVAQMQHWWADNQVSVTVTFNKQEAADIPRALELYETRLKSVSFLPLWVAEPDNEDNESKYLHPPLQPMTKEEYEKEAKRLKPIELKKQTETDGFKHKFCDNDICTLE